MSPQAFVQTVLRAYLELDETPSHARPNDRALALSLHQQQVPLDQIRAAILVASSRRLGRSPEAPKLGRIRSLAYFVPMIRELDGFEDMAGYLEYLENSALGQRGRSKDLDYTK